MRFGSHHTALFMFIAAQSLAVFEHFLFYKNGFT